MLYLQDTTEAHKMFRTGDFPSHNLPSLVHKSALEISVNLLTEHFPGTPIIPAIGNNDAKSNYGFSCNDTGFEMLLSVWDGWIPKAQKEHFLLMGAYTKEVDGIFFIVFNTNAYTKKHPGTDDCGQMDWVERMLKKAKTEKKKYVILTKVFFLIFEFTSFCCCCCYYCC